MGALTQRRCRNQSQGTSTTPLAASAEHFFVGKGGFGPIYIGVVLVTDDGDGDGNHCSEVQMEVAIKQLNRYDQAPFFLSWLLLWICCFVNH